MKIEEFERIVWNLANQGFVRYFLNIKPGFMIIQLLSGNNLKSARVYGIEDEGFEWDEDNEWYVIERE